MMAKKTNWFDAVKRFFGLGTHSRAEKKEKRRRRKWMLFNRPQVKRLAPVAAPSQKPTEVVDDSEHLQSKNALSVALATAAAAEAAVAAAQVAAEVFKLSNIRPPSLQHKQEALESSNVHEDNNKEAETIHQCEKELQEAGAIKIQAAFRGFLARKALRALKGIVKLQAIIRGRAVRRHAMNTLKRLQSIVDIHSQVCTTRSQKVEGTWHYQENFKIKHLRDNIKVERNMQRRWDDSLLSKKETDALFLSKREAAVKRERIKEYSYNPRRSSESESRKPNGRWRYWLEQWVDTQLAKSKEFEDLDPVLTTNAKPNEEEDRRNRNLKQRSHSKQRQFEALESPTMVTRRQIRHKKQCSMGDDNFSASPALPTYMAATQSAKAKARPLSSPKLRPGAFDTYSDSYSPYKNRLSLMSSIVSEVPSYRSTKPSGQPQRSPSMKGLPGSAKSSRIVKELNID